MDPLMRKLFQPREAREKLRGMGGIMSSSPQLASTVAKFQQGGPVQRLAVPSAPDAPASLGAAIHEPSGMMYSEMSPQQLSALVGSGDRLAAEVLMEQASRVDARPVEIETTTVAPAPLPAAEDSPAPVRRRGGSRESFNLLAGIEDMFGGSSTDGRGAALDRAEQLRDMREGTTSGPGEGLEAITADNLLPPARPGMNSGPAEGLEAITADNLLPPEQAQSGEEDADQSPPPENLDLNDPATFDTTYDQMLTRLQSVMGTKDEDSRQRAMANLAMIGLAIASGQSPNALTNIAQGALTGARAIREEQAERESQDKALRMAALDAALEQEQDVRSSEAQLARDELQFQRDIALEQEKARLGGGGGRDPRAIEDFVQNVYTEALKAASSVAPPPDMTEGETPEAYAARKADTARLYMGQQFPSTYGGGGGAADPIMTRVQEALQGGMDPATLRAQFIEAYPNLDPSAYGL